MMRLVGGFFAVLVLLARVGSGQTQVPPGRPAHYVEIDLPPSVDSATVFARYVLAGEDFGGWLQQRSGVSAYVVSTTVNGRLATSIRAILYAPGCAIQTFDFPLSISKNPQYSFTCQPLRSISIAGEVVRLDRLDTRDVELQARYVARWAQAFLKPGDGTVTTIPVGDVAHLSVDGHFHLMVPDLSHDPSAGAADHPGELQIWARDTTSEAIVAQLIPAGSQPIKARMGGLKVQNAYPAEIVWAPCVANTHWLHDRFGFAARPQPEERHDCDRQ